MEKTYYMRRRDALIEGDRALRVDTARLRSLSDVETRAEDAMRILRTREATEIWGGGKSILEYDPVDGTPNVFPGMAFLTGEFFISVRRRNCSHKNGARGLVTKTKVFRVLSKVSCLPPPYDSA